MCTCSNISCIPRCVLFISSITQPVVLSQYYNKLNNMLYYNILFEAIFMMHN